MMRRILFVDDEVNILRGLRRMLRSMRREWDMSFAAGGREALDLIAESRFDVIVSDILMPGMSGFELLTEVREIYPLTVRLVLSGTADKKEMLRSVGLIHQYLPKPCEAEMLKSTISSLFSFAPLVESERIRKIVSKLEAVPSLPSILELFKKELGNPEPSLKALGGIVASDIGMSAKLLQLVHSPFLGRRRHVSGPTEAVEFAGLETMKDLAQGIGIFKSFDKETIQDLGLVPIWEHSRMVAEFARKIARAENADPVLSDSCFIAGLLHDIGKLILAQSIPDEWRQVASQAEQESIPLYQVENISLGATHAHVGAWLLGLWGFEEPVVRAVAEHHQEEGIWEREFSPRVAVYAANLIAGEGSSGENFEKWRRVCMVGN